MSRWIGKFPSLKLERMVGYQSAIERDFIYLLDFDPAVTTYKEQPMTISYLDGGKQRGYTPDFSIVLNNRTYLAECKHHQFLQEEVNGLKWRAARRWCSTHGATFHVVTDTRIRAGYRLKNVKLLTDYARYPASDATTLGVLSAAAVSANQLTVTDLLQALSPMPPPKALATILHLAYRQVLFIPLDETPITKASPVSVFQPAARYDTLQTMWG